MNYSENKYLFCLSYLSSVCVLTDRNRSISELVCEDTDQGLEDTDQGLGDTDHGLEDTDHGLGWGTQTKDWNRGLRINYKICESVANFYKKIITHDFR